MNLLIYPLNLETLETIKTPEWKQQRHQKTSDTVLVSVLLTLDIISHHL